MGIEFNEERDFMMRIIKKSIVILIFLMMFSTFSMTADAQENQGVVSEKETLMIATENIKILESPDEDSKVMLSIEKNNPVIVTGITKNGWYQISYQDKMGYIQKKYLQAMNINQDEMQQAMGDDEIKDKLFIEEVERLRAERRRSQIWGIIIVLLVVAIFMLGIVSSLQEKKKDMMNEEDKEKTAKKMKCHKELLKDEGENKSLIQNSSLSKCNNSEEQVQPQELNIIDLENDTDRMD